LGTNWSSPQNMPLLEKADLTKNNKTVINQQYLLRLVCYYKLAFIAVRRYSNVFFLQWFFLFFLKNYKIQGFVFFNERNHQGFSFLLSGDSVFMLVKSFFVFDESVSMSGECIPSFVWNSSLRILCSMICFLRSMDLIASLITKITIGQRKTMR
jgi:hypothetical protein